jgi:hypothetical protein
VLKHSAPSSLSFEEIAKKLGLNSVKQRMEKRGRRNSGKFLRGASIGSENIRGFRANLVVEAHVFIERDYRKLRAKPRDCRASECELRLPIYDLRVFQA